MNMKDIANLRESNLLKEEELENKIKALKLEQKKIWVGWYGVPADGIDVPFEFETPKGSRLLCEGVSIDGNYICCGYEWQSFSAYFPNPLKD